MEVVVLTAEKIAWFKWGKLGELDNATMKGWQINWNNDIVAKETRKLKNKERSLGAECRW